MITINSWLRGRQTDFRKEECVLKNTTAGQQALASYLNNYMIKTRLLSSKNRNREHVIYMTQMNVYLGAERLLK